MPFVRFPRNYRIFNQGDSGDTVVALVEGEVDVYVGGTHIFRMGAEHNKAVSMHHLVANGTGILGEMAVLTGDSRSATVVAASKVPRCSHSNSPSC